MQNHGREVLRWAVLKRTANEPGKPFRLLRKVRDFDEDSDDSDLDSALEHDTQSIMSTNRHEGQDGRNEEYDFEEDSLDDYP